ncbi:alpha/beta-hydrolase [Auricularia subglabra TFB-10046 SS5]|uniref:Alpha/beta-hydrolase n=1 Tax=Auricularia subglabra (strain TFB-10046 / SS5) TaxID=717982 RepID=J0WRT3_AURST|nr:alpha/beta-hydrolase [Auricularia subglabra TFB-10046 SS5]
MTLAQFEDTYGAYSKTHKTSRGLNYRFIHVPATAAHGTTLLWLHGFPSSVYEWHYQIDYFHAKGYGIIAPDMLGYGGTDKPADAALYTRSAMARDIMDIVESLKLEKRPVAIAHDWGAALLGRIVDLYSEAFAAFAFFNVGYQPPSPMPFNLAAVLAWSKANLGTENIAYWEFFTKDDADKIIEQNFDSFTDLLHPTDIPKIWGEHIMVRGATEAFITQNKRVPRATYITDEEYDAMRKHLAGEGRGLRGPLNWYSAVVQGHNTTDDAELAKKGAKTVPQPVFYAACDGDVVGHPNFALGPLRALAKDLTVAEFLGAGHWVYLEHSDKLNQDLGKWLDEKVLAS